MSGMHHFHDANCSQVFRWVNAPTKTDLEGVLQRISTCSGRILVKNGKLTQDESPLRLVDTQ